MSAISTREKRLIVATLLVLCYAVVGFTARNRVDTWKELLKKAEDTRRELVTRVSLIDRVDYWTQRYEDDRDLMPLYAQGVKLDTHWYKILDDAMKVSGLGISRRSPPSPEKIAVGDVYEIAIDCNDWRGGVDNLVRFLYDLHSAGVMLDVRKLYIRPEARSPGSLNGNFTLFCAFMRENQPAN